MKTTSDTKRSLRLSLAFALACVVMTIATFAKFGGALPLSAHGYRVQIPLPDAQSLVTGSDVRTAGVKIGRVVDVARAGGQAVATVELQPQYVPMREGAAAIVRAKTLLGEAYIEVAPGPRTAPALRENARLAATRVREAVPLDAFLSTFDPETRRRMRGLIRGIGTAFDGRGQAVNETLATAEPLTADATDLLRIADRQGGQLTRLISDSGAVFETLGRRQGALRSAIRATDDVLTATARRDRELKRTVASLPRFLASARGAADTISATAPQLDRAAGALLPLATPLNRAVSAIDRTAPTTRAVFRRLGPVSRTARRRLRDVDAILRVTPRALEQLYPALREVIPIVQLLATYRESALIGPLGTVASAGNGKDVGPGGKIATYAGGTLYAANETLGGWVRRLPSDRSNPYPTPDGLLEMARQGFFSSYDCRHLGNPNPLPPLGTGVPPCKQQGPWTYRGKTAFYPRLQRAAP